MLFQNCLVEQTIDGQNLFILNALGIEKVIKNPSILTELTPIVRKVFISKIKEYKDYSQLKFALGLVNKRWIPYTLLTKKDQILRVHLEDIVCEVCGWEGSIANPDVIDSYIGANKSFPILEWKQKCLNCGTELLRPAAQTFLISNKKD